MEAQDYRSIRDSVLIAQFVDRRTSVKAVKDAGSVHETVRGLRKSFGAGAHGQALDMLVKFKHRHDPAGELFWQKVVQQLQDSAAKGAFDGRQ